MGHLVATYLCIFAIACGAPQARDNQNSVELDSEIEVEQISEANGLRVAARGTLLATGSMAWTFVVANESAESVMIVWDESGFETTDGSGSSFYSLGEPDRPESVEIGPAQTRTVHITTPARPDRSHVVLVFNDGSARRSWRGRQRGGFSAHATETPSGSYSPGPTGGCVRGCACGNSCIDCSKTCRGGSTYRHRQR